MELIEKARELAKHTETIACTPHWGVDDQETLECLIIEITELQAQLAKAKVEAESLAMTMWKQHYKSISPGWGLCDSVAGVISQIDNMVAGLVERKALDAEILRAAKEVFNNHHIHKKHNISSLSAWEENKCVCIICEAVRAREVVE